MAHLDRIDSAMLVRPPHCRDWTPASATDFRFGWDADYISRYGQRFSPWAFLKNSAAVLGYAHLHGPTDLMGAMSRQLVDILSPHVEWDEISAYVVNDFVFPYLWREFRPPFYGAFMNGVTAYGLLYLFEATGDADHLSLARSLLDAMASPNRRTPLMTERAGRIWLHEYVWRPDSAAPPGITVNAGWNCSGIYSGHIHALLPLMRFKAMTGESLFDTTITGALNTVRTEFGQQILEDRYFSDSKEMPEYPDYGQARAWHLLDGAGKGDGRGRSCAHGQAGAGLLQGEYRGPRQGYSAGREQCMPACGVGADGTRIRGLAPAEPCQFCQSDHAPGMIGPSRAGRPLRPARGQRQRRRSAWPVRRCHRR